MLILFSELATAFWFQFFDLFVFLLILAHSLSPGNLDVIDQRHRTESRTSLTSSHGQAAQHTDTYSLVGLPARIRSTGKLLQASGLAKLGAPVNCYNLFNKPYSEQKYNRTNGGSYNRTNQSIC